jgi:shikimate kinase
MISFMKDYKVILLGSQCSGKSTIISHLQETTDLVCIDHDEEIKRRHEGVYPSDHVYVSNEVLPSIEDAVLEMDAVIYSASFWGLGTDKAIHDEKIELAKQKGFLFVYLKTDKDILLSRNKTRIENSPYPDASGAFDWYVSVYEDMQSKNYFDCEIDTNQTVEQITQELLSFLESE